VCAFNIRFSYLFMSLYESRMTHLLFIPEKIHIERLSSNDDVIIKSRLSLVVCSRLFARAPVYFRKWPLIRAAPSLSSREGRCLAFYPGIVNSPRPERTFEAGVLRYFLLLLISHDATIKDSGVMETVGDIP